MAALVLSVLACAALPISLAPDRHVSVIVTATGRKNPSAKSSEVWVSERGANGLLGHGQLADGWQRRAGALVSYQQQPATLRLEGEVSPDYRLAFTRHPSSGVVVISVDGVAFEYDLYSETDGASLEFDVWQHAPKTVARLGRACALACLEFGAIFLVIISLLSFMSRRKSGPPVSESGGTELFLLALPSLLVYAAVLLAMWPSQLSPDSIDQWIQIVQSHYRDHHPALQTMFMGLLARPWQSPAAISIFHIVALTVATVLVLVELGRMGLPRWARGLAAIVFPLVPANGLMVTTIWKDVSYGIALMYLFWLILMLVRTEGRCAASTGWRAAFVVFLFAAMVSRHNAIVVALGLPLAFAVSYRRQAGLFFTASTAGLLAALILVKVVLLPFFGITPIAKNFLSMVALHVVGAHLAAGTGFSEEERQVLQKIHPLAQWKERYDCQSSVPLYWSPDISYGALADHARELNVLALEKSLHHPGVLIRHELCATSMLWRIVPFAGERMILMPMEIYRSPDSEWIGLRLEPKLHRLNRLLHLAVDETSRPGSVWFAWRPAFWLLATIVICGGLTLSWRSGRYLLLTVPSLLSTASIVPAIGSPDWRYQYPVFMIGLLLAFMIFAHRPVATGAGAGS